MFFCLLACGFAIHISHANENKKKTKRLHDVIMFVVVVVAVYACNQYHCKRLE